MKSFNRNVTHRTFDQYVNEFNIIEFGITGASEREPIVVPDNYVVNKVTVDRWRDELKSMLVKKALMLKKAYRGNKGLYEASPNGIYIDGMIQINTELLDKYSPVDGAELSKYRTREVY